MLSNKGLRYMVSYTKSGSVVKFGKQFNSKFHMKNYISKMKESGYTDIKVLEKGNFLGVFNISFIKEGKEKKITKKFITEKAKNSYVEALKRDKCKNITCNIEIKSVSYKEGDSFKYIPSREDEQIFYYNRTNKKSRL